MINSSTNTGPHESHAVRASRRPIPYLDWLYGCVALVLVAISIGVAVEWRYLELTSYECFLCPDDIGWPAFTFAYAIPGLAFGSVIWALMSLGRLCHEAKSDQLKSTVVILFVSVALLMAAIYYLYWLPAAQNNLNIDSEWTKSIVKISTTVNPYPHPDEPQGSFYGTGIIIDSERGWIVTNAHVVARVPSENSLLFSADPTGQTYLAKKVYVDPYLDIAVLEGPQSYFQTPVRSATLDCEGTMGGEIVAIGYAGGDDASLRVVKGSGYGSSIRYGKRWFVTDAAYQNGMSGGPTIDRQSGRVVGIFTKGYTEGNPYYQGFAIPARYVCRIINLLRIGVDPTPPQIPVSFFDNLAEVGKLVVAKTDGSDTENSLFEEDIILSVEGFEGEVASESDLIDALRGATYPINLRIVRDGTERLVPVSFGKMEDQRRRSLLYVSGLVIGESRFLNRPDDDHRQELMMRMVEFPGFSWVEFNFWERDESYIIVSVDGIIFDDIRALRLYLSGVQRTNQEAVFKLKLPRSDEGMRDAYSRLSIAPSDIRLIQ